MDRSRQYPLDAVGNDWSTAAFDGPFYQTPVREPTPSVGVIFVHSAEGNTGTDDPQALGAGSTDKHLVYEGLSRVAADAVIAGAGTLHAGAFFSVWRPELVSLRAALGLPRHPIQVVMTATGRVAVDEILLFNVPNVPVLVITSTAGAERLRPALARRPWVSTVESGSLREQLERVQQFGIRRACAVGGRRSATQLVDAGVVSDLYLTRTTSTRAEANTPWYVGERRPRTQLVIAKAWDEESGPVRFEHRLLH